MYLYTTYRGRPPKSPDRKNIFPLPPCGVCRSPVPSVYIHKRYKRKNTQKKRRARRAPSEEEDHTAPDPTEHRAPSSRSASSVFGMVFGKRRSPRVGRGVNLYVEGAHERTRQRRPKHTLTHSPLTHTTGWRARVKNKGYRRGGRVRVAPDAPDAPVTGPWV